MKAANNRGEDFYDPERKDNMLGKNKTRLGTVGRAPQRPNCGSG